MPSAHLYSYMTERGGEVFEEIVALLDHCMNLKFFCCTIDKFSRTPQFYTQKMGGYTNDLFGYARECKEGVNL